MLRGNRFHTHQAMTQKEMVEKIRGMGCVVKIREGGEYRVNLRGGTEATAYYTYDRLDAVETARELLRRHQECLNEGSVPNEEVA